MGLLKVLKKVVRVATAPITLPTEVVINTARGRSPIEPVADAARTTAEVAGVAANVANLPNRIVINLAAEVAGPGGKIFAEIMVGPSMYSVQVPATSADLLATMLEGEIPPGTLLSPELTSAVVLLSSAITVAAQEFDKVGKPIPPAVQQRLGPYFPSGVMERAEYTVGTVGINLPEIINQVQGRFFGNHEHAVTVDDVIVFSTEPADDAAGLEWWAHELHHVRQYAEWGVTRFAYRYITKYKSVEDEAVDRAAEIMQALRGG